MRKLRLYISAALLVGTLFAFASCSNNQAAALLKNKTELVNQNFELNKRIEAEDGRVLSSESSVLVEETESSYGFSNNGCVSFVKNVTNDYIEYLFVAPYEGKYAINFASRTNTGLTNNLQKWQVNDKTYDVFLNSVPGQGKNTKGYNIHDRFVVELQAGENTIKVYQQTGVNYLDYFVILDEFAPINAILEAENYASGIYKANVKTAYSSEYLLQAPMSNENRILINTRVNKTGYYDLFIK